MSLNSFGLFNNEPYSPVDEFIVKDARGFLVAIDCICNACPGQKQMLLFSSSFQAYTFYLSRTKLELSISLGWFQIKNIALFLED